MYTYNYYTLCIAMYFIWYTPYLQPDTQIRNQTNPARDNDDEPPDLGSHFLGTYPRYIPPGND